MTVTLTTLYREARIRHKTRYPDGKKCAIPSLPAGRQGLHRDSFVAKVPDSVRRFRRVTQPPFIVGFIAFEKSDYCLLDNLS